MTTLSRHDGRPHRRHEGTILSVDRHAWWSGSCAGRDLSALAGDRNHSTSREALGQVGAARASTRVYDRVSGQHQRSFAAAAPCGLAKAYSSSEAGCRLSDGSALVWGGRRRGRTEWTIRPAPAAR